MISPAGDKMFPELENLLSWTSKRQQALAGNVANMDTPGYHAKDYSFADQLSSLTMSATSGMHIAPMEDTSSAHMYEVGTKEKPNGNNVDLEREMSALTQNAVEYQTLSSIEHTRLGMLQSAIGSGS